jgi:S-(hydroxymethyl)mycothiol dehydrogenase
MQQVRAVVAKSKGAPVTVETINVPDPGPGEAVVRVQACGVCHTDLHYREGGINDEFPFLLGHEAAGVVEAVGEGVENVVPGDFVVLNWRAVCGSCRACDRGEPWYCFATHNATQKMTPRRAPRSPLLGIGASARRRSWRGSARGRPVAALPRWACWARHGRLGAAINTGHVGRGQSVGHRLRRSRFGASGRRAGKIIAVDIRQAGLGP